MSFSARWVCIPTPRLRASSAGLAHQVPAHRERRAWRHHDAQHRIPAGVVIGVDHAQHVLDDRALVLDQAVGRQAAFADADAHGAAARMEAHADLPRDLDLVVEPAAVRVKIEMVHRGGAAGEHQFRHRGFRRGLEHLRRQPLPHRKQRRQPIEQFAVLRRRQCAGQGLEHVMMGVDEARNDDVALEIEHFVGRLRQLGGRTDRDDAMIGNEQAAVADLAPRRIHGHQDVGVLDQHGPWHGAPGWRRHDEFDFATALAARCDLLMQDRFQFGAAGFRRKCSFPSPRRCGEGSG